MPRQGKRGVFDERPSSITVRFEGKNLNFAAISRSSKGEIHSSTLSRMFLGKRPITLKYAEHLAALLDMPVDDFLKSFRLFIEQRQQPAA